MARKPTHEVNYEFETMSRVPDIDQYHFYSVGSYNESKRSLQNFLDRVAETNLKSISYEQFFLTPDDILKRMVPANKRTVITLSPESHDPRGGRAWPGAAYTPTSKWRTGSRELSTIGIHHIDIWYFIGMPEQDAKSVNGTVEYCGHLLRRFKGKSVNPMICPMIPFLDPASTFFEFPQEHGYRVFHRTAEQHRRGMERSSILNRINYETLWLTRSDLVNVGFRAVRGLMEAKGEFGALPKFCVQEYNGKIDDALRFIPVVHDVDCIDDPQERRRELNGLGDEIERRNRIIFESGRDEPGLSGESRNRRPLVRRIRVGRSGP